MRIVISRNQIGVIRRQVADPAEVEAGDHSQPRPEMLPFVPATAKRVLELGCAEGAFAATVKERTGGEVWGIESNPQVAEHARAVIDRVLVGDADERIAELPDTISTRSVQRRAGTSC